MGVEGNSKQVVDVGKVKVSTGYVRVDIQGTEKSGEYFAELEKLIVASETQALKLDYVKSNAGNMFYWGRRGPSVHLRYLVPRDQKIQYSY